MQTQGAAQHLACIHLHPAGDSCKMKRLESSATGAKCGAGSDRLRCLAGWSTLHSMLIGQIRIRATLSGSPVLIRRPCGSPATRISHAVIGSCPFCPNLEVTESQFEANNQ